MYSILPLRQADLILMRPAEREEDYPFALPRGHLVEVGIDSPGREKLDLIMYS